jgi:hypothetical protein
MRVLSQNVLFLTFKQLSIFEKLSKLKIKGLELHCTCPAMAACLAHPVIVPVSTERKKQRNRKKQCSNDNKREEKVRDGNGWEGQT